MGQNCTKHAKDSQNGARNLQGNGVLRGLRKREEETKIQTPPTEPLESPRETLGAEKNVLPNNDFFDTSIK